MSEPNYKNGGLKRNKYMIFKCGEESKDPETGTMLPELIPVDPDAEYFVLRVDKDPHAQNALRSYARSVMGDNQELAVELFDWLKNDLPELWRKT